MQVRRARLRAFAKINLSLRVLNKRPDGFHELRTVFQSISLADRIEIEFAPGGAPGVEVVSNPAIPDNLAERAAHALYDAAGLRGTTVIRLRKDIPMGGGLGGGSTDAAAVLLALPVLAGAPVPLADLHTIAAQLGSDVPFFLYGGTALGLGRGTELYPLETPRAPAGLIVSTGVHSSTAEAYRALNRGLTDIDPSPNLYSLQTLAWRLGGAVSAGAPGWPALCENDFEAPLFSSHPELEQVRSGLERLGAEPARMTGSGSAIFGLFARRSARDRAALAFPDYQVFPISLLSRARYQSEWLRALARHATENTWPPQSRYSQ